MIGERLRKIRTEQHYTQEDMAKLLNITRAAYSYYESGIRVPSLDTLGILADHFHISLDYLYGRSDSPDFFPLTTTKEALLLECYHNADVRGKDTILNTAYHEYILKKHTAASSSNTTIPPKKRSPKNPFLQHK